MHILDGIMDGKFNAITEKKSTSKHRNAFLVMICPAISCVQDAWAILAPVVMVAEVIPVMLYSKMMIAVAALDRLP